MQKARVLNSSQTKYFLIDRVTLYISERYFKGILMGLYTNGNKSQFTYNAYQASTLNSRNCTCMIIKLSEFDITSLNVR